MTNTKVWTNMKVFFFLCLLDKYDRQTMFRVNILEGEGKKKQIRQWRLRNCGNTTEATTLLQQFYQKHNWLYQNREKVC